MESGLRPATNQLENRQQRFGLRLFSLPDEEGTRGVVGANSAIGKRLGAALRYNWMETEKTVLPGTQTAFDVQVIQEEQEEANKEAEEERP